MCWSELIKGYVVNLTGMMGTSDKKGLGTADVSSQHTVVLTLDWLLDACANILQGNDNK